MMICNRGTIKNLLRQSTMALVFSCLLYLPTSVAWIVTDGIPPFEQNHERYVYYVNEVPSEVLQGIVIYVDARTLHLDDHEGGFRFFTKQYPRNLSALSNPRGDRGFLGNVFSQNIFKFLLPPDTYIRQTVPETNPLIERRRIDMDSIVIFSTDYHFTAVSSATLSTIGVRILAAATRYLPSLQASQEDLMHALHTIMEFPESNASVDAIVNLMREDLRAANEPWVLVDQTSAPDNSSGSDDSDDSDEEDSTYASFINPSSSIYNDPQLSAWLDPASRGSRTPSPAI